MNLNLIYAELVAGTLPRAKTKPEMAIPLAAGAALHTPRVHFVSSVEESALFYIAAPSRVMASNPGFKTELAAALPGHPAHQGDGAYFLELGAHAAVIIRQGASVRYLYNSLDAVEAALQFESVPVIQVRDAEPWALASMASRAQESGNLVGQWLTKVATIWTLAATLVFGGALSFSTYQNAARQSDAAQNQLNGLLAQAALSQPMAETVAKLQRLSAVAVKAGGWIARYRMNGRDESYLIWLPAWVSRDYIDELGDAKTELDREQNMVRAYKGKLKEQKQ